MSTFDQRQKNQMLQMLEDLVNIDSGSFDKDGVDRVGEYLTDQYQKLDFTVTKYTNNEFGDNLVLRHKNAAQPYILILAHMDTVFPKVQRRKDLSISKAITLLVQV